MEDIAATAGVARRSVYNNFHDKDALFTEIVAEAIGYAEGFVRGLPDAFGARVEAAGVPTALRELGVRLAVAVLRPQVIALRRLLISEARTFPGLAREYFDRAPGRVIRALAAIFTQLSRRGELRVPSPRLGAEQFAYLVIGAPLDRAVLVGVIPPRRRIVAAANAGVKTFLARHGTGRPRSVEPARARLE
jgi:TetR/AcrR family transcriptional repressor of mexJK operon